MINTTAIKMNTYEVEQMQRTLDGLRADMEKLRDIPDMPEAALEILRQWTIRPDDLTE